MQQNVYSDAFLVELHQSRLRRRGRLRVCNAHVLHRASDRLVAQTLLNQGEVDVFLHQVRG